MDRPSEVSTTWTGWVGFASILLVIIGAIDFFEGLIAVIRGEYYAIHGGQLIIFDTTTWGWITMIMGVLLFLVGARASRASRAGPAGWPVARSSTCSPSSVWLGNTSYPLWTLTMITLEIVVIYALTFVGATSPRIDVAAAVGSSRGGRLEARSPRLPRQNGCVTERPPVTRIAPAYPDRVEVRGRDLTGDLMGRLSFTEYFHLLLTGREPTEDAALLPRPAARRDRRARDDADERRRADDARRRPGLAAGRGRGRHPRLPGRSSSAPPRSARGCSCAQRGAAGDAGAVAGDSRAPRAAAKRAGLRPPGAPAGRSARRADPRARRRARRERRARRARARASATAVAEAWGRPLHDERLDADRRGAARPRLPGRDRQGDPDPRPHGRACSRTSPRSRSDPIGFLHGGGRGGRDRLRAARDDARAGGRDPALGRAARARRRRATARSSRTCSSARRSTARSSPPRSQPRSAARRHRRAPAHREGRAAGDRDGREPDRHAPLRRAATRSSASTRRAARPARRATSR